MRIRGRGLAFAFVGAAFVLVACGEVLVVPDPDAGTGRLDATSPSATADTTPPALPTDGGPSPVDASKADTATTTDATLDDASDGSASDASADATADVLVEAGSDGGTSVVLGPDGIVRGTVGGTIVHKWRGSLVATDARCPAGSTVMNGCCVWEGTFANLTVTSIPIVFDLATRAGTLAGEPIGAFGAGPPDPDGTVVFQINPSANHFTKEWPAMEALGLLNGESAATVAASKAFYALDVARPVIFSLSYARVRWNAARSEISLFENHLLQRKGGCGTGASGQSAWTLKSL